LARLLKAAAKFIAVPDDRKAAVVFLRTYVYVNKTLDPAAVRINAYD
jgi:hypothetical protein